MVYVWPTISFLSLVTQVRKDRRMALAKEQKRDLLDGMLMAVEQDLFRQQLEVDALQAELSVADENQKPATQAALDNTNANISRLKARQGAWKAHLDKLG
jgi:hypothetical protein